MKVQFITEGSEISDIPTFQTLKSGYLVTNLSGVSVQSSKNGMGGKVSFTAKGKPVLTVEVVTNPGMFSNSLGDSCAILVNPKDSYSGARLGADSPAEAVKVFNRMLAMVFTKYDLDLLDIADTRRKLLKQVYPDLVRRFAMEEYD